MNFHTVLVQAIKRSWGGEVRSVLMNRNRVALCLLTGLIITGSFAGCVTDKGITTTTTTTFPPPPLRPLNREILNRVKDKNALQYYISAWVILENEKFWDYPDTIPVESREMEHSQDWVWQWDKMTSKWVSVVSPPHDIKMINGVSVFRYGSRIKEIVIDKETPGILFEDPTPNIDDRMILKICFDPRRPNDFLQFKETVEGLFVLDPPGDREISYSSLIYRQRVRELPLLLIRGDENVRDLLRMEYVPATGRPVGPHSDNADQPPRLIHRESRE
jgi:hypothetical protein